MDFAVWVWVSEVAKTTSIFGVVDAANPGQLPQISQKGHWAEYRRPREDRFPSAADAKAAIAKDGYYLMGASVTVREAFGPPI